MPSVPITSRGTVDAQAKGNDRFRYTAPQNLVGPAVEGFGKTLQNVAADIDAIEATYDEADALRVVNEHSAYERERLRTGENAYLTSKGFAAGEGRETAVTDLKTAAENLLGGARSERAKNMAKRALDARLGVAEERIAEHATGQMFAARNGQSLARIEGATIDAVDARGTEQFAVNMGVAVEEQKALGARLGMGEVEIKLEVAKLTEAIYSKEILAIDAEDGEPTSALARLEAVKDFLSPDAEAKLRVSLKPRVLTARFDEVVSSGGLAEFLPVPVEGEPVTAGTITLTGAPGDVGSELSKAGYSSAVVAGFLGNFEIEAGYGGAQGDGGTASGIAQWRHERRDNFKKQFGKDPHKATPAEQARFVVWEMNNPEAAGMTIAQRDAILNAKTPQEAAALIDKNYERSSGAHRAKRQQAADRIAGAVGGNLTNPDDPALNSATMREAAKKYAEANNLSEEETQALYASADRAVQQARADRAQMEDAADRRLQDWINNNMPDPDSLTSIGQIPTSILSGASADTIAAINARIQQTQDRIQAKNDAEAAARAANDEQAAIFELYTLTDEQLASVDMRKYAGRVGIDKLGPWIDRQQSASKGVVGTSVSNDRIAVKIDSLGKAYGASRAADASDEEKKAWIALRGYVEKQVRGKPNKDVTDEELRGIIVAGMTEVEVLGSGVIRNDKMPRAMVQGQFKSVIPPAQKRTIEANLRSRLSRDPTEAEVWDAYQAGKARGAWE